VDHVVVRTGDPESVKHLYGHQLAIRLALDRTFQDWGTRLLFFRIGGLTIEVAASLAEEVDAGAADELWGIAYRVPDADGARERLAGDGFDVSEVRRGRKPGTRVFGPVGDAWVQPCAWRLLPKETRRRSWGNRQRSR
jgi:catechol 2,3-dioxygenase-like lactoylglutathione lyase family enzyme